MARVVDCESGRELVGAVEIGSFLADHGIWYRTFAGRMDEGATDEEILAAHAGPIEELKAQGHYVTADVINVTKETPGLDDMLQKFAAEHWHDEDEVRLIVGGRGVFHIHPEGGPVFRIHVEAGDMINVPKETRHWFNLCEDKSIRAIRLFRDPAGWVPHYTGSNLEQVYPQAVLLDIEGTTTPISFVYDVLFPYAAARMETYCAARKPEAAEAIQLLRHEFEQEQEEEEEGAVPDFGNGAAYARYLMEQDRKSTGLKALQGLIWEEGYRTGELRGPVFADVPDVLRRWHEMGIRIRVFSSGSVLAQKLLFSHTKHGDLTSLFEGFHDTTTGPKQETAAYVAIAGALDLAPHQVLFLSDVVRELDAASTAGMKTGLMLRPGNKPTDAGKHRTYGSFAELLPQGR
jgi:2,3-diketo-5-methylthio-1-phosphopentane phosphatase